MASRPMIWTCFSVAVILLLTERRRSRSAGTSGASTPSHSRTARALPVEALTLPSKRGWPLGWVKTPERAMSVPPGSWATTSLSVMRPAASSTRARAWRITPPRKTRVSAAKPMEPAMPVGMTRAPFSAVLVPPSCGATACPEGAVPLLSFLPLPAAGASHSSRSILAAAMWPLSVISLTFTPSGSFTSNSPPMLVLPTSKAMPLASPPSAPATTSLSRVNAWASAPGRA